MDISYDVTVHRASYSYLMRIIALLVQIIAGVSVVRADAHYSATVGEVQQMVIRSDEYEGDAFLRATCTGGGIVELRLGAEFDVGQGRGEPVTLSLQSKGKKVRIHGRSFPSADSQMTGGSELLSSFSTKDEIFVVLLSGAPIRLSGSIPKEGAINFGPKATAALASFLKCEPR